MVTPARSRTVNGRRRSPWAAQKSTDCEWKSIRNNSPSIFPLDVLLHFSPHLDQTAPNLLEERHHLVDLGIARQLELWLTRLCGGRTWYAGYWQPAGQQLLLQRCIPALQAGDL